MRRVVTVLAAIAVVAAACTSSTDTTTSPGSSPSSSTTTGASTSTTSGPVTTTTQVPSTTTTVDPLSGVASGLFCRDLQPLGIGYADAVRYWIAEGRPDRMDADRNGIPCETVYPEAEVAAYWAASGGTGLPAGGSGFAGALIDVPLIDAGTYGGPSWPRSLDGVAFIDDVPTSLHRALVDLGFAIVPNADTYPAGYELDSLTFSGRMSTVYDRLSPYAGRAVFVTTDVAYHLWHLVFDTILRETEEQRLLPVLEEFVADLVDAARDQVAATADPVAADAALRAQHHLEAVASVLGLDVGPLPPSAAAEVALVEEAAQWTASPTIGGDPPPRYWVDYSLMRPRGHYTRSDDLIRYFKAMALLGNVPFSTADAETLRVGLLISRLITTDEASSRRWETLYEPTAFLVGAADDYTPFEAAAAAEQVVAGGLGDPANLASDTVVLDVGRELMATRQVQIDPASASLRTMGVRFVLDSWIYDQLTDPGVAERTQPTPLDLASVMGSGFAFEVMARSGEPQRFPGYSDRITDLAGTVAARTIEDWGRTVYDGWLWALEPQFVEQYEAAFPPFMRSEAWAAKAHTTGLASYTELKHDTILYAKQGIAEGEAPEPPPAPRHWVEPDPVAFGRLSSLAGMMRDGLASAGLMVDDYDADTADPWSGPERTRWLIDRYLALVDRFARIASDELDGDPISADDNEFLGFIGGHIAFLEEVIARGEIEPAPLIADIFLDPTSDSVLEVATGPLDTIHVLVPNDDGGWEIATGAVSSYYEFWGPRAQRMTDEEWWQEIVDDTNPDRPTWWLEHHG